MRSEQEARMLTDDDKQQREKMCVRQVVLCKPPLRTWQSPLSGRETTKKKKTEQDLL